MKRQGMDSMDSSEMKVVILAGGQGTRFREEPEIRPKPMVEVGGKPIIWHIMKIYSHYGFNDFIVSAGYKSEWIKRYFLDYATMSTDFTIDLSAGNNKLQIHDGEEKEKWKVTVVDTGLETQTGGRIKLVRKYINKTFMATYGDGVANINIPKLVESHEQTRKENGTIATLTAVHPIARFGEIGFEPDGKRVKHFMEKPQTDRDWINGGFFVLEPEIFDYISQPVTNFESQTLTTVAQEGKLAAYKHDGYWRCMDTLRDCQHLNEEWKEGKAGWKIW